jgi:dCMP deaminase
MQRDATHEIPINLTFFRSSKWDLRFLQLAKQISTWSKDPSTQVGAVLVNDLKQVVGMGYNGFPRKVEDSDERLNNRELKYQIVVHAEVNAIVQAGHEARGSTLYVYPSFMLPPICADCAGVAIQAGVIGIVGYNPDPEDERVKRWADSISVAREMWNEAGLFTVSYPEEGNATA